MLKIYTVKFTNCDSMHEFFTTKIKAKIPGNLWAFDLMILKAAEKLWGKNAFFWEDNGLGKNYGQIMKSINPRGATSLATALTGRLRVEITDSKGDVLF
jgi:hypothetical protein